MIPDAQTSCGSCHVPYPEQSLAGRLLKNDPEALVHPPGSGLVDLPSDLKADLEKGGENEKLVKEKLVHAPPKKQEEKKTEDMK